MKVCFVYMGAEYLGVEYLAAAARAAGHEVELAFDPAVFGGHLMWNIPRLARIFDRRPAIVKQIVTGDYDATAFSCFSANYQWALSIAGEIRKQAPRMKTIFGGVHVNAVPGLVFARPEVDALITGEADESFPALLSSWESDGNNDGIPGVWEKTPGGKNIRWDGPPPAADVQSLPFPDKEIFYGQHPALSRHYSIMTSRGCPYNCTYCNASRYSRYGGSRPPAGTRPVRRRTVDSVISELAAAKDRHHVEMVIFRDDVFGIMRRDWFGEFAARYRSEIALPYYCWTHPSVVNEENARLLAESGCSFISVGVQSADEEKRRSLMNRRHTNEQVRRAVELLRGQGITVSLDHIVGFPDDTIESLEESAEFFNSLRPDRLQSYWLVYLPGTELLDHAVSEKHLSKEDRREIENGNVGFLFGKPGSPDTDPAFRKFMLIFSLIPLLPEKWITALIRRKAWRLMPGALWLNNLVVFINALRVRDPLFFYLVKFLLKALGPARGMKR